MQLKNNNPVAMEKRTDLASLFCMIGRHGPAVAVAVIAMVSVVAGFIIYRSVKGKRRKAEAGAGDVGSSSPAARQDSSLPQLEKEPSPECDARSPVESTDVGEAVPKARVAGGTRSRRRQRNGRGAAEKKTLPSSPPKREVEPEKLCNASHVEETSGIPLNVEGDVKTLQDDGSEAKALEFQQDYFSSPHTQHSNSAEGGCSSSFEPVEVHESLGNEEKVQTSLEDEVPRQEEGNPCSLNSPVCHDENAPVGLNGDEKPNDQVASDSISTVGYFEKPTLHKHESLLSTEKERESSVLDTSGFSQSHTANLATENIPLHNPACDQPLTVTSPTMPASDGADEQSPNGEETEHKNSLGEILVNCAVLQSSKELELEQDASTCSKENIEDVKYSFGETQETSALVSSPVIPCSSLSVKPETIQEDQVLPSAGLNQELKIEDDITNELVNKSAAPIDLACPESETVPEILIPKENAKILSSGDREPNAVGSEASSDASASTEMSLPDDSSFQNQSEQLQNAENREVPNASAPVMAESIEPEIGKDQLLHENQSKLTWCLPDVGEESGISSMTVSPDLPEDGECSFTHENVLLTGVDDHPQSEDQAELQTAMGESPSVIVEDPADATLDSSNDAQHHSDVNEANALCTVHETLHHGIECFNKAGQLSKAAPTDICASEDLGKMESKIVIKGKLEEESKEADTTTEINIMEATMDHNEWITDGTDQDHPWVKPSIASVPQINPVFPEECIQSSFPVNTTCRNADVPPVNEDEQLNTVPSTDEPTETGKRVLAVQPMPQNVSVTFRIHYLTHSPYQKVAITGNRWELGNWKDFIPLEKAKDGLWATVVSLPAERHVEWKFVVMDRGEVCRWEECGNRFLDTGNGENLLVHKCWGLL
uniref:Starch-binding domain-containing protein 1 n=1 Tax=Fundulus heteroclitus TaxID=8078 RepID=A0A3Q2NXD0_FUNHE